MKTGIFGGAFNPVHNGHIALARHYMTSLGLDRIIFIPTHIPPHKTDELLASEADRINMLAVALSGFDNYEIDDCEFRREGKSYTYDTLVYLKDKYPDDDFYLIVGEDQYLYFDKWYRYEDILKLATVVTACRHINRYKELSEYKSSHTEMKNSIVSDFDVTEVSSSQIRAGIKAKKDISFLVPDGVEKYIKEHGLYV